MRQGKPHKCESFEDVSLWAVPDSRGKVAMKGTVLGAETKVIFEVIIGSDQGGIRTYRSTDVNCASQVYAACVALRLMGARVDAVAQP